MEQNKSQKKTKTKENEKNSEKPMKYLKRLSINGIGHKNRELRIFNITVLCKRHLLTFYTTWQWIKHDLCYAIEQSSTLSCCNGLFGKAKWDGIEVKTQIDSKRTLAYLMMPKLNRRINEYRIKCAECTLPTRNNQRHINNDNMFLSCPSVRSTFLSIFFMLFYREVCACPRIFRCSSVGTTIRTIKPIW